MLNNFITAQKAKTQAQISTDKTIAAELERIQSAITASINKENFGIKWKVPHNLDERQINHILEFLVEQQYVVFFQGSDGFNKLVKCFESQIPQTLQEIFEPQEVIFTISWAETFEEVRGTTYHYSPFNTAKDIERMDLTARLTR